MLPLWAKEKEKAFAHIVGKGENPTMFSTQWKAEMISRTIGTFNLLSAAAINFGGSKMCYGQGLSTRVLNF